MQLIPCYNPSLYLQCLHPLCLSSICIVRASYLILSSLVSSQSHKSAALSYLSLSPYSLHSLLHSCQLISFLLAKLEMGTGDDYLEETQLDIPVPRKDTEKDEMMMEYYLAHNRMLATAKE